MILPELASGRRAPRENSALNVMLFVMHQMIAYISADRLESIYWETHMEYSCLNQALPIMNTIVKFKSITF